jgi:hypothetical protein
MLSIVAMTQPFFCIIDVNFQKITVKWLLGVVAKQTATTHCLTVGVAAIQTATTLFL